MVDAHEWAERIAKLDLTKTLIPPADQATGAGRAKGTGVVFSNHVGETLVAENDDERISLMLRKGRPRRDGGEGQKCYQFEVVERSVKPVDTDE